MTDFHKFRLNNTTGAIIIYNNFLIVLLWPCCVYCRSLMKGKVHAWESGITCKRNERLGVLFYFKSRNSVTTIALLDTDKDFDSIYLAPYNSIQTLISKVIYHTVTGNRWFFLLNTSSYMLNIDALWFFVIKCSLFAIN